MFVDLWLLRNGTAEGHIIMLDFENLQLGHLPKLSFMHLKKFMLYLQVGNINIYGLQILIMFKNNLKYKSHLLRFYFIFLCSYFETSLRHIFYPYLHHIIQLLQNVRHGQSNATRQEL